ncbi:MAG TPA: hypothetical protein VGS06_36955, partial [Streptosporangiaceae bacterium]|nr:hypothetical protein [Streptosporangiaceae bacterium]
TLTEVAGPGDGGLITMFTSHLAMLARDDPTRIRQGRSKSKSPSATSTERTVLLGVEAGISAFS